MASLIGPIQAIARLRQRWGMAEQKPSPDALARFEQDLRAAGIKGAAVDLRRRVMPEEALAALRAGIAAAMACPPDSTPARVANTATAAIIGNVDAKAVIPASVDDVANFLHRRLRDGLMAGKSIPELVEGVEQLAPLPEAGK